VQDRTLSVEGLAGPLALVLSDILFNPAGVTVYEDFKWDKAANFHSLRDSVHNRGFLRFLDLTAFGDVQVLLQFISDT